MDTITNNQQAEQFNPQARFREEWLRDGNWPWEADTGTPKKLKNTSKKSGRKILYWLMLLFNVSLALMFLRLVLLGNTRDYFSLTATLLMAIVWVALIIGETRQNVRKN